MGNIVGHMSKAILVLGMHRSGTSALTRIINLLGAEIGINLLGAASDNQKGFWENRTIVNIHERFLLELGASWDDPRILRGGWECSEAAQRASVEIEQALRTEFGSASLLVIKDPRMCRLVPLWRATLERVDISPCALLVVRDPDEVVGSLIERNAISPPIAALLWLRHVVESVNAIGDMPHSVVLYDEVLSDWRGTVEKISRDLDLSWRHDSAEVRASIDAFVEPSLRHQHVESVRAHLPVEWRRFLGGAYDALRAAAAGQLDWGDLCRSLSECCEHFLFAEPIISELVPPTELAELRGQLDDTRQRADELEKGLQRQKAMATELVVVRESLEHELTKTQDVLRAKDRELEELSENLRLVSADAAGKDVEIAELGSQVQQLELVMQEGSRALQEANERLTEAEAVQHQTKDELAKKVSELRATSAQLETSEQGRFAALAELAQMQRSFAWRAMAPVRVLARRFPRTASRALSGVRAIWDVVTLHPGRLVNRLRQRRQAELVRESGLFDAQWYLRANTDVRAAGIDPLVHFVTTGADEGRSPNILFDAEWYAKRYADVDGAGLNALVHYVEVGAAEGRDPHPLFVSDFVAEWIPSDGKSRLTQLARFLAHAESVPTGTHPLFHVEWYKAKYEAANKVPSAWLHYLEYGAASGMQPNGLFDPLWYAIQTGERPEHALAHYVATKGAMGEPHALFHSRWFASQRPSDMGIAASPLETFFKIASDLEVSSHPLIDAAWYLEKYPDVRQAGLNAALHFAEWGGIEGRDPSPLFMSHWYQVRYLHAGQLRVNPLQHYLMYGARDGLNPNPLFHTRWYAASDSDSANNPENPLVDFVLAPPACQRDPHPLFSICYFREKSSCGGDSVKLLARYLRDPALFRTSPHPLFDANWYMTRYEDVRSAGLNPLLHYLDVGAREGRDPNPLFDTRWYWTSHREVRESDENPLVHYVTTTPGRREDPSPLFSRSHYLVLHPELKGTDTDPLEHALHEAAAMNVDPVTLIGSMRSGMQSRWLGLDLKLIEPQRLAIGIVTYNNPAEQLDQAIRSIEVAIRCKPELLESTRLYVIDNGDRRLITEVSGAQFVRIESRGNVGFGRAHNLLMEQAFADGCDAYIAFNPDGAFHPGAVAALLEMHAACGRAALIEAMQFPEEHPKTFSTWDFETHWASGACLFIPRAIHEAVGGFDDDFFMYCEDVDLSWRVRAAGMHVKICPRALFFHPVTDRPYDPAVHARFLTSGVILATKWGGDEFAAGLLREMESRGMDAPDVAGLSRRAGVEGIADFDNLFSFARTRW